MSRSALLIAGNPPNRLKAAFDAVSGMHHAFDRHPVGDKSYNHCILSAETAALAFRAMGFAAQVEPCMISCVRYGALNTVERVGAIGSLDGAPYEGQPANRWNGHMITLVEGFLFDPTFCQIDKERELPMMFTVPISRRAVQGLEVLSSFGGVIAERRCDIHWVHTPNNTGSAPQSPPTNLISAICRDVVTALLAVFDSSQLHELERSRSAVNQ